MDGHSCGGLVPTERRHGPGRGALLAAVIPFGVTALQHSCCRRARETVCSSNKFMVQISSGVLSCVCSSSDRDVMKITFVISERVIRKNLVPHLPVAGPRDRGMGRHETKTKAPTRRSSLPAWTDRQKAGRGCSTASNGRGRSTYCRNGLDTVTSGWIRCDAIVGPLAVKGYLRLAARAYRSAYKQRLDKRGCETLFGPASTPVKIS